MPLYDLQPIILNDTYVAPNATLIGEVFLGAQTTVWYGATLRADINAIRYNFSLIISTVLNFLESVATAALVIKLSLTPLLLYPSEFPLQSTSVNKFKFSEGKLT